MQKNTSHDVSVASDGIKIGWNIMAALAAIGMGMYVHLVLTPLRSDILHNKEEIGKIRTKDTSIANKLATLAEAVDERIDKCEMSEAAIKYRLLLLEGNRLQP